MSEFRTLSEIQKDHLEWSTRNFGLDRHPYQALLGMIEEWGEFIQEKTHLRRREYLEDALADFMVFLIDFCNLLDLNLEEDLDLKMSDLQRQSEANSHLFNTSRLVEKMQIHLGLLSHSILKLDQGIRQQEDHQRQINKSLTILVRNVWLLSGKLWIDLEQTLNDVWNRVRQRDWTSESKPSKIDHQALIQSVNHLIETSELNDVPQEVEQWLRPHLSYLTQLLTGSQ